jgi:hypothetical protein
MSVDPRRRALQRRQGVDGPRRVEGEGAPGPTPGTGHAERFADAVYGTILVLAVVAALSEDDHATAGAIVGAALATSLVFWIVHVYAEVLSRRASGDGIAWWPLVRQAARQEWPLVQAAFLPSIPLVLGAVGLLARSTAITLALVVGLADLAAWGYFAGRALRQSRIRSLVSAAGAAGLGTLMVLLKNLVH